MRTKKQRDKDMPCFIIFGFSIMYLNKYETQLKKINSQSLRKGFFLGFSPSKWIFTGKKIDI